ncbi:uncharacterized protein AB675_2576 [Cyphellophora attinorum]|uniref:AB hydrolase-1 domain-containing protein n=1 Tax=Cyphellophora attinorum TaxID=1664694 RepID=A0A0N1HGZ0_9EURO|nr:uncharacterized protein AB675_2576 [Phialophora attinorum]KPI45095.1 hypothetical protein AB675_2576 [Phialophora attinorum]
MASHPSDALENGSNNVNKPTILLVPGAWHSPPAYRALTDYLRQHGYTVVEIAHPSVNLHPSYTSYSAENPPPAFAADVAEVRKHILAQGSDPIVIFAHSYGSVPASSACADLPPTTTIKHFIVSSGFPLPVGMSMLDAIPGRQPPEWWDVSEDGLTFRPANPAHIFYNDVKDPETLQEAVAALGVHSYACVESEGGKQRHAVWENTKCTYIVTTQDNAISPEAQRHMVQGAQQMAREAGKGGEMSSVELFSSHSPHLSMPEELGLVIRRCAGEEL